MPDIMVTSCIDDLIIRGRLATSERREGWYERGCGKYN